PPRHTAHPPPPHPSPLFYFPAPPTTQPYTLSLHDALPIFRPARSASSMPRSEASCPAASASKARRTVEHKRRSSDTWFSVRAVRSEEHTSELQSPYDLVCRLLLEKKKKKAL